MNVCNILFLIDLILYILIPQSIVFRCTFIFFDYSKHLYNYLPNTSCHLLPHTIWSSLMCPRPFCNKFILKHLKRVPFEFSSLHSHDFHGSFSSNVYLKIKVSNHKHVLWDDMLTIFNLIIYAIWSLFSSSRDKIDLTRVLATVESN
jgi:hypothetical protein